MGKDNDEKKLLKPGNVTQTPNEKPKYTDSHTHGGNQMAYLKKSEKLKRTKAEETFITREEVAKHNKRDDAWVIFKDKVYDVTLYLDYHPGGVDILLDHAGEDVTEFVYEYHPWVNVQAILQNVFLGYVKD